MESTDYNGLKLNIDRLETLFPFYFAFDGKINLIKTGKSLTKILPSLRLKKKVSTYFSLEEGGNSTSFFNAVEDGASGVLSVGKSGKLLKGSFLKNEKNGLTYFLANLSLTHINDLKRLKLDRSDFSTHDTGLDILYHTHSNQTDLNKILEENQKLSVRNKRLSLKVEKQYDLIIQAIKLLKEPLRRNIGFLSSLEKRFRQSESEEVLISFFHLNNNIFLIKRLVDALDKYLKAQNPVHFTEEIELEMILTSILLDLASLIAEKEALIQLKNGVRVSVNFQDLKYILTTLIENAISFNKSVPPAIRISCEKTGNVFQFCVEDNGIGVGTNSKELIFQPFAQSTGAYNGIGMNLATCKRILERDGGKIWVEENPSGGSRFYFTVINK